MVTISDYLRMRKQKFKNEETCLRIDRNWRSRLGSVLA